MESQTPFFTREAWVLLHSKVLSKIGDDVFMRSDQGPATLWCQLVEAETKNGGGCAVLDATVTVTDADTIKKIRPDFYGLNMGQVSFRQMQERFPQWFPCSAEEEKAAACAAQRPWLPRGKCLARSNALDDWLDNEAVGS